MSIIKLVVVLFWRLLITCTLAVSFVGRFVLFRSETYELWTQIIGLHVQSCSPRVVFLISKRGVSGGGGGGGDIIHYDTSSLAKATPLDTQHRLWMYGRSQNKVPIPYS